MHGLAVKAAYTLGLHSKENFAGLSERQQETRKRVWWGCVNLDRFVKSLPELPFTLLRSSRILGMTFGRPFMIPASNCVVGLPTPIEDEEPHVARSDGNKAINVWFLSASM